MLLCVFCVVNKAIILSIFMWESVSWMEWMNWPTNKPDELRLWIQSDNVESTLGWGGDGKKLAK